MSLVRPLEDILEPAEMEKLRTLQSTTDVFLVGRVSPDGSNIIVAFPGATFAPQNVPIVVHQQGGPGGTMTNRWGTTSEDPFNPETRVKVRQVIREKHQIQWKLTYINIS